MVHELSENGLETQDYSSPPGFNPDLSALGNGFTWGGGCVVKN